MMKRLIPVVIKSPWLGELNAQLGVASAIAPYLSEHIVVPDPFWQTDVEKSFKSSKGECTRRQKAGQESLQLALQVVRMHCNGIDPENDIPVIINMGGRDSAAFLSLAVKTLYPHAFLMNILYPKLAESYYDLLALPPAESYRESQVPSIQIGSVPNKVRYDIIGKAKEIWAPILRKNNKETIAVIVGGYTGVGEGVKSFTLQHGQELVHQIMQIREQTKCNFVLTTSRRTPEDVTRFLQDELSPVCSYSYFPSQDVPNPYMGYMACADAFVVTADSMSMLSEAADTGKRVYSYYPQDIMSTEHVRFYTTLLDNGNITPLPTSVEFGPGRPIRAAEQIAKTITDMIESGYRPNGRTDDILSGEYALH